MKKWIAICFIAVMMVVYCLNLSAEVVFVYAPHNKHDPFNPLVTKTGSVQIYEADLTVSDMTLEGIMEDPGGNSAAIINGKIVKIGDQIGPYQVQSVINDHVILLKDGEGFTLNIKKGG